MSNINSLNQKAKPFLAREFKTKEDLISFYNQQFQEYGGLIEKPRKGCNDQIDEIFDEKTKLVIVGSAIPFDVPFFYCGKNCYIYKWIDEQKGTSLEKYVKNKDFNSLKHELKKLGLVFLDLAEWCCHVKNSRTDNDILGYVIDSVRFDRLANYMKNEQIKVISASGDVKNVLDKRLRIKNEYCGLVAFPKKEPWLEIIKEYL